MNGPAVDTFYVCTLLGWNRCSVLFYCRFNRTLLGDVVATTLLRLQIDFVDASNTNLINLNISLNVSEKIHQINMQKYFLNYKLPVHSKLNMDRENNDFWKEFRLQTLLLFNRSYSFWCEFQRHTFSNCISENILHISKYDLRIQSKLYIFQKALHSCVSDSFKISLYSKANYVLIM